jgi:hypothetical protein
MKNGETVCCVVAGRLNPKQHPARKADANPPTNKKFFDKKKVHEFRRKGILWQ